MLPAKQAWEWKRFWLAVIERIPHPEGDEDAPLQALIFDSVFNSFRGIIAYFKIVNGVIRKGDHVKFFDTGKEYDADEIGVLKMDMVPRDGVRTGDVGYIISGIKTSREVKVGDTITHIARPCREAIAGFEEVKPMVFAGVYPIEAEDFENLAFFAGEAAAERCFADLPARVFARPGIRFPVRFPRLAPHGDCAGTS